VCDSGRIDTLLALPL